MNLSYKHRDSPVGRLKLVASDTGHVAILWEHDDPQRVPLGDLVMQPEHRILIETERQLNEYFDGTRDTFSIPLELRGTEFQKEVWRALQEIPFGTTSSYDEIARQQTGDLLP